MDPPGVLPLMVYTEGEAPKEGVPQDSLRVAVKKGMDFTSEYMNG